MQQKYNTKSALRAVRQKNKCVQSRGRERGKQEGGRRRLSARSFENAQNGERLGGGRRAAGAWDARRSAVVSDVRMERESACTRGSLRPPVCVQQREEKGERRKRG